MREGGADDERLIVLLDLWDWGIGEIQEARQG